MLDIPFQHQTENTKYDMCCCSASQCCCGCTSWKAGIIIWAMIDAIINIGATIVPLTLIGPGFHIWGFGVGLVDIMLAVGAHIGNTGLMSVWLVFIVIHIICSWTVLPLLVSKNRRCPKSQQVQSVEFSNVAADGAKKNQNFQNLLAKKSSNCFEDSPPRFDEKQTSVHCSLNM
jgi:hypothetical protein